MVIINPILKNSLNVIDVFILDSMFSKIMIFEAAPKIVKLPAIVDVAANS
jgi:hypothetical protein